MASLCCNDRARDSCFGNAYYGRRSCSKAQACLAKIIHLISTIPPPPPENNFEKRGFDIDLNLRLGCFLDDEDDGSDEKSESLAENSFDGKNPDVEEGTEENQEKTATATDASSDVTEMQKSDELKSGTDVEVKTTATAGERFTDSLDLLIEAAELISERDKEVEKLYEFDGDVSPVVRSKRGRCQVLPQRYRDSVLEPWKKRPQKTTAAAAMVSSKKRRSR